MREVSMSAIGSRVESLSQKEKKKKKRPKADPATKMNISSA